VYLKKKKEKKRKENTAAHNVNITREVETAQNKLHARFSSMKPNMKGRESGRRP